MFRVNLFQFFLFIDDFVEHNFGEKCWTADGLMVYVAGGENISINTMLDEYEEALSNGWGQDISEVYD